jgi:hypothetical protein
LGKTLPTSHNLKNKRAVPTLVPPCPVAPASSLWLFTGRKPVPLSSPHPLFTFAKLPFCLIVHLTEWDGRGAPGVCALWRGDTQVRP